MKRYPESFAGHVTGRLLLKKLVQLFAVLLVAGCGEKSSSEGSDSAGASAEPPADTAKQNPAGSPVADSPSESATPPSEDVKPSADSPKPLISDADAERLLKEAVDMESLEERDGLSYLNNEPYSGWAKTMSDSGYGKGLTQFKDGKISGLYTTWYENGQKKDELTYKDGQLDGLWTRWYENGQKSSEETYKDGKSDGPHTSWHENGQKAAEGTSKDGEEVSGKYWNSKGEEVETAAEAFE